MSGHLVPVVRIEKSNRRKSANERAGRHRRSGSASYAPSLVAGRRTKRDMALLERAEAPKVAVDATPPAAAVNHATTPASAARRLTPRHLKIGGGIAAGVGAAGAGGYVLHRRAQRFDELEKAIGGSGATGAALRRVRANADRTWSKPLRRKDGAQLQGVAQRPAGTLLAGRGTPALKDGPDMFAPPLSAAQASRDVARGPFGDTKPLGSFSAQKKRPSRRQRRADRNAPLSTEFDGLFGKGLFGAGRKAAKVAKPRKPARPDQAAAALRRVDDQLAQGTTRGSGWDFGGAPRSPHSYDPNNPTKSWTFGKAAADRGLRQIAAYAAGTRNMAGGVPTQLKSDPLSRKLFPTNHQVGPLGRRALVNTKAGTAQKGAQRYGAR